MKIVIFEFERNATDAACSDGIMVLIIVSLADFVSKRCPLTKPTNIFYDELVC